MTDVDTMRWGDSERVLLATTAAAGEGGVSFSKQMLNAHWQRPCVWRLMLSMKSEMAAADALITFDVTVLMNVGLGQTNLEIPLTVQSFPVAGDFVTLFFDIPAENIQLRFSVGNLGNAITNLSDSVVVTAMAAPRAEPGGIVQIRDHLPGNDGIREPDRDGLARWPGRGFEDGETRYRGQGY